MGIGFWFISNRIVRATKENQYEPGSQGYKQGGLPVVWTKW